jgi:predicted oxidoreductase (fatty acid repression mutant protein)
LIQNAVRESPSSFNSQSSRVVILLGDEHDKYWEDIVLASLKKVTDEEGYNHAKGRIDGFKAGYGTVLFYEDEETISGMQEKFAAYKDKFPLWSNHASGMAQIHTWTALELAG